MNDLLQEIIVGLVELVDDVSKNEGRPSVEQLVNRLGRLTAMATTYQQNLQIQPPAEPYKMDAPTIDKIEAAINGGRHITIEPDGTVMVYPEGTQDQALPPPPATPETREPQTITPADIGQMPASIVAGDDV